jgi:beta-1,4-mannosyl-glycoprotein beta-1,4-N-acetylglucosaminyltransferase
MIYDCFTYFDEAEILDLRLQMLHSVIDMFVIVESKWTFSGQKKDYTASSVINNHKLKSSLKRKVNIIMLEDGPMYSDSYIANWEREQYQRDSILRGLTDLKTSDMILISDVDELPDPMAVRYLSRHYFKHTNSTKSDACINLHMPTFYYQADNLMCERNGQAMFWNKAKAMLGSHLGLPDTIRNSSVNYKTLLNSGWHFSYMGGRDAIINKIKSFSHQEHNKPEVMNRLKEGIDLSEDLFGRKYKFKHYDWSKLPSEIFGSKARLKYFGVETTKE